MYNSYLERRNFLAQQFYERKYRILKEYTKGIIQLEQRSKEWLKIRQTTIGGSEVATVLGLNPYSNLRQLVAQKIGISEFNGNVATRWGCLFEEITRRWSQLACGCKNDIIELGGIEGINPRQRYSPDGLGVVPLLCETKKDASSFKTWEFFIALFEYKSPLRSFPDGKIPKHYYPQIQTGLLNVKIAEIGLFVNNSYRICSYEDLFRDATFYNKVFHNNKKEADNSFPENTVYARGIILFFVKKGEYVPFYEITDYGKKDNDTIGRLLYYYDKKQVLAYYTPISHTSSDNVEYSNYQNIVFKEVNIDYSSMIEAAKKNENRFIGFLPWKLMKTDIIMTRAENNWQQKIETPINNALEILDRINAAEDREEVYRREFSCIAQTDAILEEITTTILPDDWAGILDDKK